MIKALGCAQAASMRPPMRPRRRHRTALLVTLRLLLIPLASWQAGCGAAFLDRQSGSHELLVLGRLVLSARTYTLLSASLGFQLPLGLHLALHTALLARMAQQSVSTMCCLPYFTSPPVRAALHRRVGGW